MKMTAFFSLLRLKQWLKNLMILFPPFLGGILLQPGVWLEGILPLIAFCFASSASYIFNDIRDREKDQCHPLKRNRPLANGTISVSFAAFVASGMLGGAIVVGWLSSLPFLSWLILYVALSFAYSLGMKDKPVIDIFCIASGFVFRVFAGAEAFDVQVSDWLFLSVLLLALFLSCGKRLSEKHVLGDSCSDHRKVLSAYPAGTLEGFMFISGAAVLVTYTLYVITMHRLIYTVPLCCFGLFRYILVVGLGRSGDPTDLLLKDPVMLLIGISWIIMVGINTSFLI